jgi:hypothetical protein
VEGTESASLTVTSTLHKGAMIGLYNKLVKVAGHD